MSSQLVCIPPVAFRFLLSPSLHILKTEPTEDWTVEQVLQWWLLRAHGECDGEYARIVDDLSQQLKAGKDALWRAHQEVSEILNNGVDGAAQQQDNFPLSAVDGLENSNPQQQHRSGNDNLQKPTAASATDESVATSSHHQSRPRFNTIRVLIVAGPYEGETFNLQPNGRVAAFVGRSQGKKFKEKGLSLSKDLEVSTSHGKFESLGGKFYYTDIGSTNGSLIDEREIEPQKSYEIRTGQQITCGQTIMQITLVASDGNTNNTSSGSAAE